MWLMSETELKSVQMFTASVEANFSFRMKIVPAPVPPHTGTGAILKAETPAVDLIALFCYVCLSGCQLNSPSMVTACVWRLDLLWHTVFQIDNVVCIRD